MRWFNGMMCDLSAPIPEVRDLPAIEIVRWSPERSEAARLIRNESFHDHWGSIETTRERWNYFMGSPTFRPEFSFLAYSGTDPVGVVIGHEYGGDPAATGRDLYVAIRRHTEVAPQARHRLCSRGEGTGCRSPRRVRYGSLEVDADSPTGALGLYEALGFRVEHTSITLTKTLLTAEA